MEISSVDSTPIKMMSHQLAVSSLSPPPTADTCMPPDLPPPAAPAPPTPTGGGGRRRRVRPVRLFYFNSYTTLGPNWEESAQQPPVAATLHGQTCYGNRRANKELCHAINKRFG
ncbi:uncharacterized protein LOC126656515 [Mercurialis annua]|uniref:uncharacterized protein LOC126656515 n=1 Tax=Mercurialis annua TaxID=3986 RepID=UPI00215F6692|nr:uncharacterized protein LOC126656515 [Mercurialis annua]